MKPTLGVLNTPVRDDVLPHHLTKPSRGADGEVPGDQPGVEFIKALDFYVKLAGLNLEGEILYAHEWTMESGLLHNVQNDFVFFSLVNL